MRSPDLLGLLGAAGLTGRGGAAFSTATKVAAAHEHRADLIVNACDGELGAVKDGWVVEHHLDELVRGALLVGGRRKSHIRYAAHRGSTTFARLRGAGLDVLEVPERYVSSEETSLISLAHGGLARPLTKRAPFVRGGRDSAGRRIRPTVVLNAETVWRIAQVVDRGPEWFRSFGTAAEPGPRLVTVTGAVRWPYVRETEAGVAMRPLVEAAGVVDAYTESVLVGGLGGVFVTSAEAQRLRWSTEDLRPLGGSLGPGLIEVIDPGECPMAVVGNLLSFAAGESAGQCGPCMFGVPAVATDWREVESGSAEALARLQSRVALLPGRGACRFPDGVGRLVRSAVRVFGAHVAGHLAGDCPPVRRGARAVAG